MLKDREMPVVAVITADIVASGKIRQPLLESRMKELSREIETRLFRRRKTFEFFRGDSFQGVLPEAADALRIALLWRAGIMSAEDKTGWDIRIALGFGKVEHEGSRVSTSSGSAFEYSGTLLDELKRSGANIGMRSSDSAWNEWMTAQCQLADALMLRFTPGSAQAVYFQLLYEETQEQLAERLGIAQSSVHKRLQTANWNALKSWEESFRRHALSYLKTS